MCGTVIGEKDLHSLRLEYAQRKTLYDVIKRDAAYARDVMQTLTTEATNWETVVEDKGNKVQYRYDKENKLYVFRLEATLDVSAYGLTAVCMEVDLYNTWIPTFMGFGFKNLTVLNHVDHYRKFAHGVCALPWPISNRDVAVVAYGVDLLDQGSMLILAHSAESLPPFPTSTIDWATFPELKDALEAKSSAAVRVNTDAINIAPLDADEQNVFNQKLASMIPPEKGGLIRAKCPHGGFLITPLGENQSKITFYAELDPNMALPAFVINIALRHFAFDTLELLKNAALKITDPKSPHCPRIAQRQQIYDLLRSRLGQVAAYSPEEKEAKRLASIAKLRGEITETPAKPKILEGDDSASAATPEPAGAASEIAAAP